MTLAFIVGWIAGTIVNELLKTLINKTSWRLYRAGDRRDPTHVRQWTDAAGKSHGRDTPSRRDVYEHYHGQDSWRTRCSRIIFTWRLLALVFSSCCGLLVVHAISRIPQGEVAGYALGILLLIGLVSFISGFIRDL